VALKASLALIAATAIAILATSAIATRQDPDEQGAQRAIERLVKRDSNVAPAQGRLTAWFETRNLPVWHDSQGKTPLWQEFGPRVLRNGWGGMDNAGRCGTVAVDPTDRRIVWLGSASGGVWRTDDECRTWTPMSDQSASLSIGAIAIDPFDHNTIYAGTGEPHNSLDSFHGAGLLRSTDAGRTWDLLSSEVYLGTQFSRIVPNPHRRGFLYAATGRGVLRSLDGGATWVQLLRGAATDLLIDPASPNTLVACIGYTGGNVRNGLFKSTDSGQTWRRLTRDLPANPRALARMQMANCAAFPNVMYVSLFATNGRLNGIYKTDDFGESWMRLPNAPDYGGGQSWYDNYVAVSPTNPNVVFVGGTSTHRTLDGGQTWADNTRSYSDGRVHPDHHYLAFSPVDPSTVYLCTDGGVFRSRDLGENWEAVNDGLRTIQFQSVDVHPWDEKIAYGGTQDNGTNKYTGDPAWTNVFLGDGGVTHVNWKNPDVVYTEYVGLVILKSTNAGGSWDWGVTRGIDPGENKLFYAPYNLDPSDPDTLVAGARKVYRSTDAASNWTAISPVLGRAPVSAVVVAPSSRTVIYAGTNDGKLWVTPNTGRAWYDVSAGLPGAAVSDLCVSPDNARTVYAGLNGWSPERLWKSNDAGGHWISITDNLPPMPIQAICIDPRHHSRVYIGTPIGVFVSTQGGGRWMRFGPNLPNVPVYSLVANERTGWITAGTHGRGAWRIPIED
jgi:photosystem II stability/assembly factor-like uncharacterized protein